MAFVVKDRVRQTSSTTGTGAFTLSSAVTGFQTFSVIGNGNTTSYTIVDASAGTWEVGIGTYTAAGTTLSRDVVLESSNNGNLVAFGAGVKDVFVTYPAEKAVYLDTANTFTANQVISVTNTSAALRITQAGTGNALLVEDSGNPDATPFVIDQNGTTVIGHTTSLGGSTLQVMGGDARYRFNTSPASGSFANLFRSRGTTVGANVAIQSGDQIGNINFLGADGTSYISAAGVATEVDASPATGSMPGRLVFRTTAAGASTPTERMRIDNTGAVGIGSTSLAGYALRVLKTVTGSIIGIGVRSQPTAAPDVTNSLYGFYSDANTSAAAFTLSSLHHFRAVGTTPGAGSTITTQYGFHADSGLTDAATNFGFYSNIPSGSARWNFYAAGTASNFFGGNTIINVADNTNAALRITQTGTGDALLVEDSGNPDSTPFVIDSIGRVLVGHTSSVTAAALQTPYIQIYGTVQNGIAGGVFGSYNYRADTSSGGLSCNKSRATTPGTNAVVLSGDSLGIMRFSGDDGTAFISAASISVDVDGTPGTNSMPGRLIFGTTPAGAGAALERMRITSDGRVAIGSTGNAGTTLALGKSITGSTTAVGTILNGTIQSDVTSAVHGFRSSPTTQATAFTLAELNHFSVFPQTYGAGSTVTNQYGFNVASTLTGATNNYGFYSNIASGTGRWNFYANGTAANFFGGNTIISVTDNANAALRITQLGTGNALLVEDSGNPDATPFVIDSAGRTITGGTIARSYYLPAFSANYTPSAQILGGDYTSSWAALAQWSTSTTNSGGAFLSLNKSNGVEGTHTIVTSGQRVGGIGFSGSDGVKFLGVADIYGEVDGTPGVDDMPGRLVFATTTDGTNATTEKMRINNAGAVGIGTSVLTGYNLNIGKNITGAITSYGVRSGGVVQSDVTGSAQYFFASPSTVASSFTLGALYAYRAAGGTIGVGSTVTTQIGFGVDSSLTGATNNYGFYSNLASGTGRWNFYADGTAANYFAGNVGIGIAPSGTYKLEVSGNAAATNFVTTSDRNKKTNIATIANALAKVQVLRGVTFDWVADGTASTGLIAQEVEWVMPQVVHGDEGSKAVNYGSLVGLLVEAIKEQQTTINQLLARVAQLETK